MGIFGFFKKKEIIEKEKEIVTQKELFKWILNKKEESKEKEKEFLIPIEARISQLVEELKLEISALEKVDLDSKKIDQRIKLIVRENIKNYVGFLEKITEKLIEIEELEGLVEKINFVFEDFNKKSKLTYEKITFVVGKEMQATKESIRKFLVDLGKILKENKKGLEEFKIIKSLEEDIKKLKDCELDHSTFLKILNEDAGKLKQMEEKIEIKEKEIKKLIKSERYIEEENKKIEIKRRERELENKINTIRDLINFKNLSSFYHKFEKEMSLVKRYKDNFRLTLEGEGSERLLEILKEAKLDDEKISELIKEINKDRKQLLEISFNDWGIKDLEKDIERSKSEIGVMKSEKLVKEKRLKNVEKDLEDILEKIKENLGKINVEFKR